MGVGFDRLEPPRWLYRRLRLQDRFTHERALLFVEPGHRRKRSSSVDCRETPSRRLRVSRRASFRSRRRFFSRRPVRVFRSRCFRSLSFSHLLPLPPRGHGVVLANVRVNGCAWSFQGIRFIPRRTHKILRPATSRARGLFFSCTPRVPAKSRPRRAKRPSVPRALVVAVVQTRVLHESAQSFRAATAYGFLAGRRRGQRPVGLSVRSLAAFRETSGVRRRRIRHVQSRDVERFVPELAALLREPLRDARGGVAAGHEAASPGDHARNHAGVWARGAGCERSGVRVSDAGSASWVGSVDGRTDAPGGEDGGRGDASRACAAARARRGARRGRAWMSRRAAEETRATGNS